ncbi:S8 family peptidase [Bacillus infantis]|uniref:S8 family peptidase n=1 Tax=Bacillus infantis TaxID=324767 RepID=A0A5D4RJJ6_9BACI|nr:S8 family peptidase [Bacillus infantis]TYS51100.1 S8 family peptidase [Bacillus infantis]
MDEFLPILGNGENYINPDNPRQGPPVNKKNIPTYEEARSKLLANIGEIKGNIESIDNQYRVKEVILNLKMATGFTAKSYHPSSLIRHAGAIEVGSKKWTKKTVDKKNQVKELIGKEIFLRMSDESLSYFESQLQQKESILPKGFIEDIRLTEEFFFPNNTNLFSIFGDKWDSGRIELVLHPFEDLEDEVIYKFETLYAKNGGNPEKIKWRSYYPGPLFASLYVNRGILNNVLNFNPIRTAHPLRAKTMPIPTRGLTNIPMPKYPQGGYNSAITVGMFDGGVDDRNPYFKDFVIAHDATASYEDTEFMKHGNAVAGALLYGDLRNISTPALPTPAVKVESFRVFPLTDPTDPDLYEVIDAIEAFVPKRDDIKVFNLSIGPEGAIEDDNISRFTYAIDKLSENGERLFVVAVGNDGDHPLDEERRIQAPADTINNLSVGSFTYDPASKIIRAPYSSIGIGREGCKVKPDVVAFGGCDDNLFHLVGYDGINKFFERGTSFAAPLVAAKAAEIVGRCSVASPLVARALIINSANHPNKKYDKYLGYGVIPETVEEIIGCEKNKITVLYKQKMLPKQYSKLEIPIVKGLDYDGKVNIRWTIVIATKPNGIHTEDYTTNCIEDIFYPNINTYIFKSPEKKTKKLNYLKDKEQIEELMNLGWKPGRYPSSKSGNKYENEEQRKANFKWDSVVKRDVSLKYEELDSPYLVLHAMDRNVAIPGDFFNYAIVATIDYVDYQGDAYTRTLDNFNKLNAISVKARNEVLVR